MNIDALNIESELKKLELHYFFNDSTHTMDAVTRNKCEHEFLEIVKQLGHLLNLEISIDSEAYQEGGLRELWTILIKKNPQLVNLIVGVLIGVITSQLTTDRELTELQKKQLRLSIEKLEKEKEENNNPENTTINIEQTLFIINSDIKIKKHKSNFYNTLSKYHKVTKIETTTLNKNNEPINDPIEIVRNDFPNFILTSDDLPSVTDESAIIEIISPVLKRGKYKWKGLYDSQTIDFYMKDKLFKESVIQNKEPFKNGTYIECVLEISRKVDEFGEVKNSNYSVLTVIKKDDGIATVLTKQGKRFKAEKLAILQQLSLDFESEDE
ncbi:hypothetical protein [Marinifilum fragile]|uniref:hypothetical protein n=1 Tax=Marinifilum fragile TaxID=570161 RepID=UPI002AA70D7B|nr:hypothetical protein [Marinifilum fragile]